jgi:integrase
LVGPGAGDGLLECGPALGGAGLAVAIQTGLRATELATLTLRETHLGTGAHVSCTGKGRKQRITPLTKETVTTLKGWIKERPGLPTDPLFPPAQAPPSPETPSNGE